MNGKHEEESVKKEICGVVFGCFIRLMICEARKKIRLNYGCEQDPQVKHSRCS